MTKPIPLSDLIKKLSIFKSIFVVYVDLNLFIGKDEVSDHFQIFQFESIETCFQELFIRYLGWIKNTYTDKRIKENINNNDLCTVSDNIIEFSEHDVYIYFQSNKYATIFFDLLVEKLS